MSLSPHYRVVVDGPLMTGSYTLQLRYTFGSGVDASRRQRRGAPSGG